MTPQDVETYLGIPAHVVYAMVADPANAIKVRVDDDGENWALPPETVWALEAMPPNERTALIKLYSPPAGEYVTARVAAQIGLVSQQAIRYWAKEGKVTVWEKGPHKKMYRMEDVARVRDERMGRSAFAAVAAGGDADEGARSG